MGRKKAPDRNEPPSHKRRLDASIRDLRTLERRETFEVARRYVIHILRGWHIRRDEIDTLAQDVLADALTARERFNPERSNVRQYLHGIASHKASVFKRALRRKPLSLLGDLDSSAQSPEQDLIADGLSPEQALYAAELLASCEAAAPEPLREAIRLRAEGYTIEEICDKTGVSARAIEYFLSRAWQTIVDGPGEPGKDDPSDVRICALLPAFHVTMQRHAGPSIAPARDPAFCGAPIAPPPRSWPSTVKLIAGGIASVAAVVLLPLLRPSALDSLAIHPVPEAPAVHAAAQAASIDTSANAMPANATPANATPANATAAKHTPVSPGRISAPAGEADRLLRRARDQLAVGERKDAHALAIEHGRRYPDIRPADRNAVIATAAP